jgi:hypothetical protein
MPNSFALTLNAQNAYTSSTVVQGAVQQIPPLALSEPNLISGVFEVFGNGAVTTNTLTVGASFEIVSVLAGATGVSLTNPITNAVLAMPQFRGLYITVTRRNPAVAPTSLQATAASASSLPVSAVSTTFTVLAGLGYVTGMRVRATSNGTPTAYMEGRVTSYTTTSLVVAVDKISGTGTFADWTITGIICAQITSVNFGGVDTHATIPLPIRENGAFIYSSPVAVKATAGNSLSVLLNGTTGLNVNILVVGS